jgi:hypothetical protein
MLQLLRSLFGRTSSRARRSNPKADSRRSRPALETLEDRCLLTVVFEPHFTNPNPFLPAETVTDGHGAKVSNPPPVYLIFDGPDWKTTDSGLATQIQQSAMKLLASSYFSALPQYGASGTAIYGGSVIDDVPADQLMQGFATADPLTSIKDEIARGAFPGPGAFLATSPIYLVVTEPDLGNSGGNLAFHSNSSGMVYGWIGGFNAAAQIKHNVFQTQPLLDTYTESLSHELAEAMTDPNPLSGISSIQPGWSLFTGQGPDEIGDFEPSNFNYGYRLSNGVMVQPYWSQADRAFVVPDGTSDRFYLTPQWDSMNRFQGTYVLEVDGEQGVYGSRSSTTLDTTSQGGVLVTLNGQTVSFDPGQISRVVIYPGFNSQDLVRIAGVPAGVSVAVVGGNVIVGSTAETIANVRGTVDVGNYFGQTSLTLDDALDPGNQLVTVHSNSIAIRGGAQITYAPASRQADGSVVGVTSVSVNTGTGANNIWIYSTAALTPVSIYGEVGSKDTVQVGLWGLSYIQGTVNVANYAGSTSLYVFDTGAASPSVLTITSSSITGSGHADINYNATPHQPGMGITSLNVYGSYAGETFYVWNPSAPVNLYALGGTTTVLDFFNENWLAIYKPRPNAFLAYDLVWEGFNLTSMWPRIVSVS